MMREFAARVWREGEWYVALALEVDIASQGESEEEALENLREALALHFEEALATSGVSTNITKATIQQSQSLGKAHTSLLQSITLCSG